MTTYELFNAQNHCLYDGDSVEAIYNKIIKDWNDGNIKKMPDADFLRVSDAEGEIDHMGKIFNDLMADIYQVIGESGRYEEEDYNRYGENV
jgi:hypothetical protein